jgi:hypothetical protein
MMTELAMDTFPRAGDFGPQHVWRLRASWSLELSPIAWRSCHWDVFKSEQFSVSEKWDPRGSVLLK